MILFHIFFLFLILNKTLSYSDRRTQRARCGDFQRLPLQRSQMMAVFFCFFLRTPVLLLGSTMRAFEVSSLMRTLSFVVILKRGEPSVLHVIVVYIYLFIFSFSLRDSFATNSWGLEFDLFRCRIIRR